MVYAIRCSVCRKKFAWNPVAGFPEKCPNDECGSRIGHDRADDDVVMPFIRSNGRTKATDQVYRDMERGSEHRAQVASEMTGAPAAEMSGVKITDLRPTTRQGDIAAPPLPPHLRDVGSFGGGQAVEHGAAVQAGPYPNAGARARTALQQHHERFTQGAGVSDRPANEVLQPGYRIRG